jgi:hypothetical protein
MNLLMKTSQRATLSAVIWLISVLTTRAADGGTVKPTGDDALRQAVVGTWCYEQDAGVASVTMFTTYREDGTAIQLIKTKFVFKKAAGVWIENRWKIEHGDLHLTPVRFRAHANDAKIDLDEAVRQLSRVDGREMLYVLKGKERKEDKVPGVPEDVQKMIDELSKK